MQHVKSMDRPTANEQLRRERQRRGWSRAYIAEQIGVADPKTVGRWERGDAFPSAYFLQRLCALFGMPAEALGLWQRENQVVCAANVSLSLVPHTTLGQQTFQPLAITPIYDPALPPALMEGLVGRSQLLCQLKLHVSAHGSSTAVALGGLPGVGKSALAVKLAHDEDIQRHFHGGILWASLGPDADVLSELKRWGNLLEIDESWLAQCESVEEWTRAIHARIGARAMLLIIDDAWTCQDALAFKIGGPNCAYLLTTRIPPVALYFAGAGTCFVDALGAEGSLELLERFVPELVSREAAHMRELASLTGGLPLALQLIGSHLQALMYSGQPRRWRGALARLKQPEARLRLNKPRAPLEPPVGLPAGTPISLYNEIELSYHQLDPATQYALNTLAGLLPHSEGFSEEDALALDGVSLEALDTLLDAGLLASMSQGRYTLHQTIVDFACFQSELAQNLQKLPARVSVLRQARGKGAPAPENAPRHASLLEEVLPTLILESEEVVRLAPSRLS